MLFDAFLSLKGMINDFENCNFDDRELVENAQQDVVTLKNYFKLDLNYIFRENPDDFYDDPLEDD